MARAWSANKVEKEVIENHQRYLERKALYKSFGCDIDKERAFIIEKAQPIYGDILEVGTGKGYFTVALAQEGYSFVSVDISEEEQKFARLNIKYLGLEERVGFKVENAESLSFGNGSFEIIFSINTLHHLINPYGVMDELMRVVTFEGKIILSDFSREGLEVVNRVHRNEGRIHPYGDFDLNKAMKYFREKEFSTERHSTTYQEIGIAYHQLI